MMLRERYKQKTCKADSIEALCRGGQVCSSVEMVVMIMERRDLATWLQLSSQLVVSDRRNTPKKGLLPLLSCCLCN